MNNLPRRTLTPFTNFPRPTMFTRRFTLISSLLLAFSLLAGCGGKQTEADEASGESASTEESTESTDETPARLTDGVEELSVDGIRVIVNVQCVL